MRDAYSNNDKLCRLMADNSGYLKNYEFLLQIFKGMINVNPRKRDRFARILANLHDNL